MFNLKKSEIYQAVLWEKLLLFRWAGLLKNLFFVVAGVCLFGFLVLVIGEDIFEVKDEILKIVMGWGILGLALAVLFWYIDLFFEKKIKLPSLKNTLSLALSGQGEINIAQFLDFEAAKALSLAKQKPEHLLYSFLKTEPKEVQFVFNRALIDRRNLTKKLLQRIASQGDNFKAPFEDIISAAASNALEKGSQTIGVGDFLSCLAAEDPIFQETLIEHNLKPDDIKELCSWFERSDKKQRQLKKFWDYNNLLKYGALGRDWASGYSLVLDEYSTDLGLVMQRNRFREIVGHKKEIKQIERILSKSTQNNVLLVGMFGTGRASMVEGLAQRVFLGQSSEVLNYKRIIALDLDQLASRIASQERVEQALNQCFQEVVRAGNIVLVIEDFHRFLEQESAVAKPGVINIAGVLAKYLQRSDFQIIAVTDYDGLHRVIEASSSILELFEKVEAPEISPAEALHLLENYTPLFEQKYHQFISFAALREILDLTTRYIQDIPLPKKALDVLDEAITWLSQNEKESVLTREHIKTIVAQRIELPLETMAEQEKEALLNLEELIHKRIIDQEEAVVKVSEALRRARVDIKERQGPMGGFLFLGPTGVGKTETCKALASIYFRSEERMIRLDMSEFQDLEDIKRLIGSHQEPGLLTAPVRETPFSLVLLDELEKAHPQILNLFLQVLDDGRITDGRGRVVDFKNTMVIATSNAGAELIRQDLAEDKEMDIVKKDLLDHLLRQGIFRPEFINRFDDVIVFKPLSRQDLLDISQLLLSKLQKHLQNKGIEFIITPELKEKIVELSYSPEFGAREMKRVIQDKVEDPLAEAILRGDLKRGDRIVVNPRDFTLYNRP